MLPKQVDLIVHTDPAHSFVEAPTELVHALNIAGQITKHSYRSPKADRYYLECDIDATTFIDALSEHDIAFQFKETLYDELCPIRQYPRAGGIH